MQKKILLTACLGAMLTACGGGGSGESHTGYLSGPQTTDTTTDSGGTGTSTTKQEAFAAGVYAGLDNDGQQTRLFVLPDGEYFGPYTVDDGSGSTEEGLIHGYSDKSFITGDESTKDADGNVIPAFSFVNQSGHDYRYLTMNIFAPSKEGQFPDVDAPSVGITGSYVSRDNISGRMAFTTKDINGSVVSLDNRTFNYEYIKQNGTTLSAVRGTYGNEDADKMTITAKGLIGIKEDQGCHYDGSIALVDGANGIFSVDATVKDLTADDSYYAVACAQEYLGKEVTGVGIFSNNGVEIYLFSDKAPHDNLGPWVFYDHITMQRITTSTTGN